MICDSNNLSKPEAHIYAFMVQHEARAKTRVWFTTSDIMGLGAWSRGHAINSMNALIARGIVIVQHEAYRADGRTRNIYALSDTHVIAHSKLASDTRGGYNE